MTLRLAAFCSIVGAYALGAQAVARPHRDICLRGQPLEKCRGFVIFEATVEGAGAGTAQTIVFGTPPVQGRSTRSDFSSYLGWTVGGMVNTDSAHALGAAVQMARFSSNPRWAVVARRRTFFRSGPTLDLSAGPLVARQPSPDGFGSVTAYGATAEVAVGLGDMIGITGGIDAAHTKTRGSAALYAGVRVGSYAALGVTALVAIANVIAPRGID
jgi:hypothetical protein